MSWRNRMKKIKEDTDSFMLRPLIKTIEESTPSHILVHTTFMLTGIAYMNRDIFNLRCISMCSISLNLLILSFMPKIPRTPFLWNIFYLFINSVWSSTIYYERSCATQMEDFMESIYMQGFFEERGFDRVAFRRLFLFAQKKEYKAGEYLKTTHQTDNHLYYIERGGVKVVRNGKVIRAYPSGKVFIGEKTFMTYLQDEQKKDFEKKNKRIYGPHYEKTTDPTADVIVAPGGATVWVWRFDVLSADMRKDRNLRNSMLAYVGHDLMDKLRVTTNQQLALMEGRSVAVGLTRHNATAGRHDQECFSFDD